MSAEPFDVICFHQIEIETRTERAQHFFHRAEVLARWRQLVRNGKRACPTHGVELRWIPADQWYACPSWPCTYTETRSRRIR